MPDTEAPAQEAFRVVGQSPAHHDFVDKVLGRRCTRPTGSCPACSTAGSWAEVASARIAAMDVSAALGAPGVVAVLAAADVPWNQVVERATGGLGELAVAMPVLAADWVRYQGEPIALVAAAPQVVSRRPPSWSTSSTRTWRARSMRRAPWSRARRSSTTRATSW